MRDVFDVQNAAGDSVAMVTCPHCGKHFPK
jgi:hypothetical protein